VWLRKLVQNISTNLQMQNQTPEQMDASTKRFVIKTFAISLAGIVWLFGYSVVYTEQPLFNESPVDKAIFGILTLVAGQLLQILANYISRSTVPIAPPITPPAAPCPPVIKPTTPTAPLPVSAPVASKPPRLDDDD
jgi:hypothetical protein